MKRKITKVFALLLMCCAFMLAGCGDSVNVNVNGNYKDTTKEAFSTYVAQVDEAKNLDAKGYKFSMTYNTKVDDKVTSASKSICNLILLAEVSTSEVCLIPPNSVI